VTALTVATFVPDGSFTGHMVEHVLLGMVAPLLLAFAAPVTLALQAGSPALRSALRRALHTRLLAAVSHPVAGLGLFGASMVALYLTPLLDLAARNGAVHVLVHVHLTVVGCLFVWPLVGVDPSPRRVPFGGRLLAVLVAVPFHAFLALALLTGTTPVAPDTYPDLADQHRAAGILWASGELLTVVVAAVVCRAWLVADRREAARLDRQLTA
jgi:putative copper resistance protein D